MNICCRYARALAPRIENWAENGDIKPESRIAVSGFQTRPHAYFVTVRAATDLPLPRSLLLYPYSVLNPIPSRALISPCVPHTVFSLNLPKHTRCAVRLCHGFTNNVSHTLHTTIHTNMHEDMNGRGRVAKSTYRPVTTD